MSRSRTRCTGAYAVLAGLSLAAAAGWAADAGRRRSREARMHRVLVELLLNALSAGDPVTERHSRRVAALTDALGASFGFRGRLRRRLRVASLLHDLGKLDDRFFDIVHSCESLDGEQRRAMETHPRESASLLRPLEAIHPGITEIVESHHESWDGDGYPRGLEGERIPLEARIISVADVFDALTQPRTYRQPLSPPEALEKIRASSGSKFDPAVVARLRSPVLLGAWREIVRNGRETEEPAAAS